MTTYSGIKKKKKKIKKTCHRFPLKALSDVELKSLSPEGLANVNSETLFIQIFQVGSVLDMN